MEKEDIATKFLDFIEDQKESLSSQAYKEALELLSEAKTQLNSKNYIWLLTIKYPKVTIDEDCIDGCGKRHYKLSIEKFSMYVPSKSLDGTLEFLFDKDHTEFEKIDYHWLYIKLDEITNNTMRSVINPDDNGDCTFLTDNIELKAERMKI